MWPLAEDKLSNIDLSTIDQAIKCIHSKQMKKIKMIKLSLQSYFSLNIYRIEIIIIDFFTSIWPFR